jgi:acyl-coenzyme A synthetase/AMP-(fatty) acid ligase
VLCAAGVSAGDRVLLYMPMIPETIFGMLASVRLGAIHSVVFGGFPAAELAKRIRHAAPTVILTASCGLESATKVIEFQRALDEAIRLSGCQPKKVLVWPRPQCETQAWTWCRRYRCARVHIRVCVYDADLVRRRRVETSERMATMGAMRGVHVRPSQLIGIANSGRSDRTVCQRVQFKAKVNRTG